MSSRYPIFHTATVTIICVLLVISRCNGLETSKAEHRRLMPCKDTDGFITYTWKDSFRVKLCNEVLEVGDDRNMLCNQQLLNMEGYGDNAIVKDACPVACGVCQAEKGSEAITRSLDSVTPFVFRRKNSKLKNMTCLKLTRKRNRGEPIKNICTQEVVSKGVSTNDKKVSDMCPDACGVDVTPPPPPPPPPTGGGNRKGKGKWADNIFQMEVIPIHSIVTPKGNVLGYGTNARGQQRADSYYTVWYPSLGTSPNSNDLLTHNTGSDIFCSNMNVDPSTGNIIIMGGDTRDKNANGIKNAQEFNYLTQEIRRHPLGDMNLGRWYPTSINLPDGQIFVIGGKAQDSTNGVPVPEVWDPEDGFKLLPGARTNIMGQKPGRNWWYPPTYVNSLGEIICIPFSGKNIPIYKYSVDGRGDVTQIGIRKFKGYQRSPSIMYRIDQVLVVDNDGGMWVIDISLKNPSFKRVNDLGHARFNGSIVILPDGCVAMFGGSTKIRDAGNNLEDAVYTIHIWDPETNTLRTGPTQKLARLYHSIALIMPDGTVLSAGGGAPGPLTNLNGQLYYPYYLFNKNGKLADRPKIESCPSNIYSKDYKPNKFSGGSFEMEVDDASRIQKITATKSGSSSHSKNCDTRWVNLAFKKGANNKITVFTDNQNIMIGGLWMINVIDIDGVPSEACLTGVNMEVELQIE